MISKENPLLSRQINFLPLGNALGIPQTTFTVLFFAIAVIAIYFSLIFDLTALIALISYFGIGAAQELADMSLILSANTVGANNRGGTKKLEMNYKTFKISMMFLAKIGASGVCL